MARKFGSAARFFLSARVLALLAPFFAASAPALISAPAFALKASDAVALEPLTIVTNPKGAAPVDHKLSVEVMRTEPERERGLMERRFLPADRGMLFQFAQEQNVMMWMKDTYIPLDMIFISATGVVTHIAENAEPMSEAIISSEGPVQGVLEVNAGYARKIGLKPGDLVRHPMFKP